MPIRSEINGRNANIRKIYASPDGKNRKVKLAYIEREGKNALVWVEQGTPQNPYRIRTASNFWHIRDDLSACYRLEADVPYLSDDPPGTEAAPFTGELDGNGHTVHASRGRAMFGANAGYIHDVKVEQTQFSKVEQSPLVQLNTVFGVIERCYSQIGELEYEESKAAGIVFENRGTVQDCKAHLQFGGKGKYAGIAFINQGTIRRCYSHIGDVDYKPDGIQCTHIAWNNQRSFSYCFAATGLYYYYFPEGSSFGKQADIPDYELVSEGVPPNWGNCKLVPRDNNNLPGSFPGLDFDKVWTIGRGSLLNQGCPMLQVIRNNY